MGLKTVAPGCTSRRAGSNDSNVTGQVKEHLPLRVGKTIENEYYAQRMAEAETRRLHSKKNKPDRRRVDPIRFELACHVIWLSEHGFSNRTIYTALELKPSFVDNVINCATIRDAVAVQPPDEMFAKCQALTDATRK